MIIILLRDVYDEEEKIVTDREEVVEEKTGSRLEILPKELISILLVEVWS